MPTAVESIASLGAVLVQLPKAPASHVTFEPGNDPGQIGGRNGHPDAKALVNKTAHHGHAPISSLGDSEYIGGRSSVGSMQFHPKPSAHNAATPFSSDHSVAAVQGNLVPAGQSPAFLMSLLLPAVHDIGTALQKVLPANQKMIEVLGIGTNHETLAVLIGLLRQAGFHANIVLCDGSVRPGFSGPTAILRAHGGAVPGQFLQQVAATGAGVWKTLGA